MDPVTGTLQTNTTLGRFADGYFNIVLKASNGVNDTKRGDFTSLKVINGNSADRTFLQPSVAIIARMLYTSTFPPLQQQQLVKEDYSYLLVRYLAGT